MVDVIVTCYNMGNTVLEAVGSVIDCEKVNKVIVVNDGSEDDTLDRLVNFNHDKLVIVSYNDNMGFGYARNKGMEYLESEYFIFLDADDEIVGFDLLLYEFYEKYYGYDVVALPVVKNESKIIYDFINRSPIGNYITGLHKVLLRRDFAKDCRYINNKQDTLPEGFFNIMIMLRKPRYAFLTLERNAHYNWRQTERSMSKNIRNSDRAFYRWCTNFFFR